MLSFNNFKKSYGRFTVLTVPEMTIEKGIYWIKGENGSGKTTLLKAVAGILSFNGDIVLYDNCSIKKHPTKYRQHVNFAEAEPLFPEFLTGVEMVEVFKHAKRGPINQEQYLIESMNMQSYIHSPIGSYSSGMLKKLSLVLAFMGNPKVILLDEPLITLDSQSVKVLYNWITETNQEKGTGFILSSHQDVDKDNLTSTRELTVAMQTVQFSG